MKGMRRLVAALIVFAGIPACTQVYWTKPGFNATDWQRDNYECERDTRMAAASFGGSTFSAQQFFGRCLTSRGYYLVRQEVQQYQQPPEGYRYQEPATCVPAGPEDCMRSADGEILSCPKCKW